MPGCKDQVDHHGTGGGGGGGGGLSSNFWGLPLFLTSFVINNGKIPFFSKKIKFGLWCRPKKRKNGPKFPQFDQNITKFFNI